MVLSIPFGTALGEQRLIQPPSIWRNLAWPTGRKFSDDSPGALGAKSAEAMIEAVGFHTPEGAYLISNRIPAPSLKTAFAYLVVSVGHYGWCFSLFRRVWEGLRLPVFVCKAQVYVRFRGRAGSEMLPWVSGDDWGEK